MTPRQQAQTILGLTMDITTAGIANAFARFSGHVNQLSIYVHPANQNYDEEIRPTVIYRAYVYLDDDTAYQQMASIIDALKAIQAGQKTLGVAA